MIIRSMKCLLAVVLLSAVPLAATAEPLNYDVVNLDANAQSEVANDLLMATFFVEQTNADATKLAGDVNRTLNQAVRLVHEFPGVKIETGSQSTWPIYDAKNRLTGWRTRAELRVESKDFDAAARAIAKIENSMQLGGMNFVLSPDTADATENRLIDTALKAFRTRADIVAKSMGAKSWRAVNLNISTGGMRPPMPVYREAKMAMAMADAVPAQEVAGGSSDISVSVNGTIQLLP